MLMFKCHTPTVGAVRQNSNMHGVIKHESWELRLIQLVEEKTS